MVIYPAVDIKDGKCVRLVQGNFSDITVFSQNPVEMALKWQEKGANFIHIVDLDGAKYGEPKNSEIIFEIAEKLNIPIQVGGGIRNIDTIQEYIDKGITRIILGTSAVENKELVKESVKKFRDKIAVGIDAKDGLVAIKGWEEKSEYKAVDFAKKMEKMGVKTIIYTDISRDGMLIGPNYEAMNQMRKAVSVKVIASGGVTQIDDIKKLQENKLDGVIVGKALYTGNVDLCRALQIVCKV